MTHIKECYQGGDWKLEKHVPVIDCPDLIGPGEAVVVSLGIGQEIAHPNTTEHHISWMELLFLPEGEKFPYVIGRCEFSAHGASVQGPNTSTVYTAPQVTVTFQTEKAGVLMAAAYCNIHGLWESSRPLALKG